MLKFSFLLFAFPVLSWSQSGGPAHPLQTSVKWHRGFIIPHSRELINVSRSNPFGVEVNVHWLLAGEQEVQQTGLIAKRGFAAYYFNFDNPRVLGHCVAAVPYVEPLVRPWGRFYGSFQLGLGLVYLSKLYDETSNPSNLFFSFPVSFWLMANTNFYYKINQNWQLSSAFNYNHISNGGMKEPNKGMNFPTYNLGIQYAFQPIEMKKPKKSKDWKTAPRNFRYLLAVGTVKNTPAEAASSSVEPGFFYGIQAMIGRRVGRLSGLSAGIEFVHDGYERILLDRRSDKTSAWKGGLLLGHELLVGRVRFTIHLGPYLYNPSRTTDVIYQRYGLFYRLGRHILIGSTLKAHRHVADVFDLRVGWVW